MPRCSYTAHSLSIGLILLAGLSCASCAEDDAVLALNVTLEDSARAAGTLAVTLTQGGQTKLTTIVNVPTMPIDGGMISKREFFDRVQLRGLSAGQAMLTVDAKQNANQDAKSLATASTVIEVELDGAVASFVTLGKPRPVMPADAGMDDAGE